MKISWGTKLLISLIVFAGIMATMVTIAMRENIDLVDKNYYQQELEYQERIDGMNNTNADKALKIDLNAIESHITLNFDSKIDGGIVHLFRPSNASEDIKIPILTDQDGIQVIPSSDLISGLWRIKVEWSKDNNDYYLEQVLNIP